MPRGNTSRFVSARLQSAPDLSVPLLRLHRPGLRPGSLPNSLTQVHMAIVLACAFLVLPTATTREPSSRAHQSMTLHRAGLVVVIENMPQSALDLRALNNPSISGVALQIRWRDIEPVQGNPDWSKTRSAVRCCGIIEEMGATPHLPRLFFACMGPGGRKDRTVPDTIRTRQRHSREASDAVGYGVPYPLVRIPETTERPVRKVSGFRVVAADGPTSVSAESTLPSTPEGR